MIKIEMQRNVIHSLIMKLKCNQGLKKLLNLNPLSGKLCCYSGNVSLIPLEAVLLKRT